MRNIHGHRAFRCPGPIDGVAVDSVSGAGEIRVAGVGRGIGIVEIEEIRPGGVGVGIIVAVSPVCPAVLSLQRRIGEGVCA